MNATKRRGAHTATSKSALGHINLAPDMKNQKSVKVFDKAKYSKFKAIACGLLTVVSIVTEKSSTPTKLVLDNDLESDGGNVHYQVSLPSPRKNLNNPTGRPAINAPNEIRVRKTDCQ